MSAELLRGTLFCSGINEKSILSVTSDTLDVGYVLITCKSFVKRYNILHRTPENSWSTKSWDPFTAGAVRDPVTKLITTVINESSLYQWALEEKDIDNVKKRKFKTSICDVVIHEGRSIVIFSSGYVQNLETALSTRKDTKPSLKRGEEKIISIKIFKKDTVVLLLLDNEGRLRICLSQIDSESGINYVDIAHETHTLIGSCILSSGCYITHWSDGSLHSLDLKNSPSLMPGVLRGYTPRLKLGKKSNIIEISPSHIAIYGMDVNDEGGILVLWDLKFGLNVSAKSLKLYKDPPLAWKIDNGILIMQGSTLCLVPFEIRPSTLAAMFGSKISDRDITNLDHCCASSQKAICPTSLYSTKSRGIAEEIRKIQAHSLSEDIISRQVIKQVIESKDAKLVYKCLEDFSLIPEKSLLAILKYFIGVSEPILEQEFTNSVYTNCTMETNEQQNLSSPFSELKSSIVDEILAKSFSTKVMSSHLHLLDFSSAMSLLNHLHYLLKAEKAELVPGVQSKTLSLQKICLWLNLILDANYHHLIMTSELDIHKKLLECLNDIAGLQSFLEESSEIDPLIEQILHSKSLPTLQENAAYSIEKLIIR